MPKPTNTDSGAPAALQRLATQELAFAREVEDAFKLLEEARAQYVEDDDVAERRLRKAKDEYTDSLERWKNIAKLLLPYDKGVSIERRDGIKIPQAEVENIITQFCRFSRIAHETLILTFAQDAIRCKDEQEAYDTFANLMRTCQEQAIINAIEHGKYPEFVKTAYERSL